MTGSYTTPAPALANILSPVPVAMAGLELVSPQPFSSDAETQIENGHAAVRTGASIVVFTDFEFAHIISEAAKSDPRIRFEAGLSSSPTSLSDGSAEWPID